MASKILFHCIVFPRRINIQKELLTNEMLITDCLRLAFYTNLFSQTVSNKPNSQYSTIPIPEAVGLMTQN